MSTIKSRRKKWNKRRYLSRVDDDKKILEKEALRIELIKYKYVSGEFSKNDSDIALSKLGIHYPATLREEWKPSITY